ncbi:pyruvate ferredoxin oxidoreductase [Patescibacteria group bacterium]|nr:MAG: pyruvate ferredoxin oxidoreductase [Patescibacteria group bacterium]
MTKKQTRLALTGGAAAAEALKHIDPDVMAVYPITPQTTIIETYAKFKADGEVTTEVIEVESEHSAISACVGASAAGARTVTATSSQGLALMHEILYIASGLRLPILLIDSARALAAPLNIHGDHSDVMGARDAGWIQIFSENGQEAYDNTIIGLKLAEKVKLPVMVIMDGFNTSHTVENLQVLDRETVQKFLGEYTPEHSLLNVDDPVTYGALALQNTYFEFKIAQAEAMQQAFADYKKVVHDYDKISGRFYDYFETYRLDEAERVIVIMGSTAGTAKDVVDRLREQGEKVGLVKINLFRPFPHAELAGVLSHVKSVAVLERAMSIGTYPPLYTEIVNTISHIEKNRPAVSSYIYSLGGREIYGKDIEKVFDDLAKGHISREIKYIGSK